MSSIDDELNKPVLHFNTRSPLVGSGLAIAYQKWPINFSQSELVGKGLEFF
jgi:hypothetical protein